MKKLYLILITILSLSIQLKAEIIYVDSNAEGSSNGNSWRTAYTDLQKALIKAGSGDEIWVAKGIYYTTEGDDKSATFKLVENVTLYGGFAGTESELTEREWAKNRTILSGNIGDQEIATDNATHVVTTANGAILDGFIVEDGYAMGGRGNKSNNGSQGNRVNQGGQGRQSGQGGQGRQSGQGKASAGGGGSHTSPENISKSSNTNAGAGILNFKTSATIRNTIVRNCSAGKGGGVYNMTNTSTRPDSSSPVPVFINVTIEGNYAMMRGGGMQNDMGTHPLLINCTFIENECGAKGGALYNDFSCSPIVMGCHFENNKAHDAAAMGNDGSSSPIIINTKIVNNVVESEGAGLFQGSYNANMRGKGNMPLVINSIIKDNHSTTNGNDNVANWGDDWIYAWRSEIDDFDYSIDKLDPIYDELIAIADKIESSSAAEIDANYTEKIKTYINSNTKTSNKKGQKGHQGFGTDNTLSKTANIPNSITYVKAGAKGGDGTRWSKAYGSLQNAIDNSGGGEIWVAAGVYTPTTDSDRTVSFRMKEGVAIYGGFSGDETDRSERDVEANKTILSGNIGKQNRSDDNSYHVILGSVNSIIDGVTIADGYADGTITNRFGGGLYSWGYESSSIVKNSTFENNYAVDGAAVFCFADVLSYFENVEFKNNRAEIGGGAAFRFGSSCELYRCNFNNNKATSRGGAMVINYGSNVILNETKFTDNQTGGNGGAIWVDDQASQYGGTKPIITDCDFTNNEAQYYGGAIHNYNVATTEIEDCNFINNRAAYGKDIANTLRSQVTIAGNKNPDTDIYTDGNSGVSGAKNSANSRVKGVAQDSEKHTVDDLEFGVTIIGSGNPTYNPERSQPSVLIHYKGTKLLVDMGNGTKTQLEKLGLTGRKAPDALMITHHHIDHNDEFISMVHTKLMSQKQFLVAGLAPIDEMTHYAAAFYEEDLNYRMSSTGRTFDKDNIKADIKVLEPGDQFEYKGLTISTIEVPHSIKTIAYRFEADGKSIVITGDLTYTADLQKLAAGADIMVMDGKISSGNTRNRRNSGGDSAASAHSTLEEAAKMAVESNPKTLVLTHLGTQKGDLAATQKTYSDLGYQGEVLIAADFLTITVDGDSFMVEELEQSQVKGQQQGQSGNRINRQQQQGQSGNRTNRQQQQGSTTQNNPMERMDSDGDNRISREEAKGPMKENFDRVDSNGDGFISAEELANRGQK